MSIILLTREISDFFLDYDMLGGATYKEMYDATLRALESNNKEDLKIILGYFYDIKDTCFRAKMIFKEVFERWLSC